MVTERIPTPPIMRANRSLQELLPPTNDERLSEYERKAALVGRKRWYRAWNGPLPKADPPPVQETEA